MKCLPGGVSVSATDLSIKECIDLEINVILIALLTTLLLGVGLLMLVDDICVHL